MRHTCVLLAMLLLGGNLAFAQKNYSQMVLMMPFCSKQILENPNHTNATLGNLCREYYQGALIATDSLNKAEIKFKLSVFDTQNDSLMTVNLLKKPAVKDADMIIGPVLQGGNKVMSDFAKGKDVLHVSPLMTMSKTKFADPNFVAPNPNTQQYPKLIIDFIKSQDGNNATILVVSDKSSLDKTITTSLKQLKGLKVKFVDYTPTIDLQSYLIAGTKVHVIIPSSSEKTVKNTLRSVKDTSLFANVSVYGFPQWLEFKSPDYLVWQQANVHIVTPFYVDYNNEDVRRFVEAYREKYYTDPSEAAFKGYDQVLYFAQQLNDKGRKFMNKADGKVTPVLHTNYKFVKQDDQSGYQNMYLNIIRIQNLSWVRVN